MTTRTTVRLPDELMREVKKLAAESDRTIASVIEDALRQLLERRPEGKVSARPLPVDGEVGLCPGVDLADGRALREILDAGRPLDRLR